MKEFLSLFIFGLIFFAPVCGRAQTEGQATDPLQVHGRIEPYRLSPQQGGQIVLDLNLPEKFHAYAEQFKLVILEPDGFRYGEFKIDPIMEFFDKFSKKRRTGIQGRAQLTLAFEAPDRLPEKSNNLIVELTYQACSDTYCLFPKAKKISLPLEWQSPIPEVQSEGSWWRQFSGEAVKSALGRNLVLAFILVFFSGILTSFTPCIFPMIPITLAILGHDSEKRSRLQNFLLSLFYVHGIATTYSLLGVAAASSGQLFGSNLGHPLVLTGMCLVFLLMALSMYGVYEIQVPAFLRHSLARHKSGVSFFGAYFSGILAGVVASPCVGPVLVTLLAFVASTQNRILGFFLLFTYAIGLGMIFLLLGAFTELMRKLPRSGAWMDLTKFILGSFMLAAFYYYLNLLIPQRLHDALFGLGLIIVASSFGAFRNVSHASKVRNILKGLVQGILVIGIGFLVIAALNLRPILLEKQMEPIEVSKNLSSWEIFSEAKIAEAKTLGRPVIIDFYADWCLACHELDEKTFSQDQVKAALSSFLKMRFDATKETPALKELRKKYRIMGLPTVVFLNKSGDWIEAETLTEFEKPEQFLKRLQRLESP